MGTSKTWFEKYVSDEVEKYRGVYRPVRASLLHRLLIRRVACKRIHPNPDDEFCDPRVGPNDQIISGYVDVIKRDKRSPRFVKCFDEPVMVERIYPDGYMLMNGHHRWAATLRMGVPKIHCKVVNTTQLSDLHEMIRNAKHDKRVTLDLDEVVFQSGQSAALEKALPFPFNLLYKERLRLGVPALFHYLKKNGYDIWVYSANYYSMEYIRKYFALYRVWVDGIVTGTARKGWFSEEDRKKLEEMIAKKSPQTIHIDNQSLMRVNSQTKEYDDYSLSGNPTTWSHEITEIIGALDKHE